MASRIRLGKGVHIYTRADAKGWWADISKHGERVKFALGTGDRKEAERLAKQHYTDLGEKPSGYTLDDALLAWLKERERTVNEKSAIRVLRAAYPNRRAEDVDSASLRAAFPDDKPATYNRRLNIVRAALNLALEHGHIKRAPKIASRPEPPRATRFLTADEYDRLRRELPEHLIAPLEFSLATGQRQANVLGLRWDQIHGDVMVIPAGNYKQRRDHAIPLGSIAKGILDRQRGNHPEFVFVYRGKPFKSPKTAYNAAKRRAGIVGVTWHHLRHSFASWMLMAGAPLIAVKEAGGWASMDSVARYAHLERKQLAEYADAGFEKMKATKGG